MQDKLLTFLRNNDVQINNYFEATVLLNLIRKKYVIQTISHLDQMRFPAITYVYGEGYENAYILDWYYNVADFNIITFGEFISEYNKHA